MPDEPPVTSAHEAPYFFFSDCGRCVTNVSSQGTNSVPRLSAATTALANGSHAASAAKPAGTHAGIAGSSAAPARTIADAEAHADVREEITSADGDVAPSDHIAQ